MPVAPSESATPPGKLRSVITYLEMLAPPWGEGPPPDVRPPAPGIRVEVLSNPPVSDYRSLYDAVGEAWLWWERRVMSDADLAAVLSDPAVEVRVLRAGDAVSGYSELDRRRAGEVEIAYFGLTPAFIGGGLGRYLMEATLRAAWAGETERVWVHTCTEDHPKALAFYQRAGFRAYRAEAVLIDDPRGAR
jgi:GNAT superfamily N-acetyltransferase